ncbi:MAG: T9SS type A sorting domain-containing protein [Lentimicrobiaceae bacterium]|nr:T9SS type A sorting domain-containing protein [Lentimicrobiaceae bacterium]
MKKVLLLSFVLAFGLTTFAQTKRVISEKAKTTVLTAHKGVVQDPLVEETAFTVAPTKAPVTNRYQDLFETQILATLYDLQSNNSVSNRIWAWPDGTVAATHTMGNQSAPSFPDRGTGYNYYDGTNWGEVPTTRVESFRSGWPSIAPLGTNGEIMVSHGGDPSRTNYYTRETKGTGEWIDHGSVGETTEGGAGASGLTWPRVATSGDNNQYVHVIACEQNNSATNETWVYYTRSTDGGATFEPMILFPELETELYFDKVYYSADDYSIATRGDVVAVLFSATFWDTFVVKSEDNGATWEKIMIYDFPFNDWTNEIIPPDLAADTMCSAVDNSATIAIGPDGKVHVAFGLTSVYHETIGESSYNYFPLREEGIVYWNEDMGQIPENPANPYRTLLPSYLRSLGMLVGECPDIDGDGVVTYDVDESYYAYRCLGMSTFPALSIDNYGTVALAYSTWDETRQDGNSYYLRTIMVSYRTDYGKWFINADNLCTSWMHLVEECVNTTAAPVAYNNAFWFLYSADEFVGNYVTYTTATDQSKEPQQSPSNNYEYAVRVVPPVEVGVGEVANIMTAVKTYPNPATDKVTVEVNLAQKSDNVTVSMFNITGQVVSSQVYAAGIGVNAFEVSTTNLETGVYFCTVEVNNYKETKKVIVK